MGLFSRLRRNTPTPALRRTLPPPGVLRRERRALLKVREQRIRDLGGLLFEMYRRDRFREDLVVERCLELTEIDSRLQELDSLLALARHRVPPVLCACGAPLIAGSHFCPNCGRPAGEQAVIACPACGHALAGDASFCPACGVAVGSAPGDEVAEGAVAAPADEQPQLEGAAAEPGPDRWER